MTGPLRGIGRPTSLELQLGAPRPRRRQPPGSGSAGRDSGAEGGRLCTLHNRLSRLSVLLTVNSDAREP
jgi:hypothetical protein